MVDWNAADYSRNSAGQQKWARELIKKLALNGSENVLDIGCGDGKVSAEIAGLLNGGSVIGIDKSKDMVSFANKNFADKFTNLSFECMDASSLTFDEKFDIVFSNATLHWIIDHRPVLRGIARALRPGGRCLLQMGGKGNAGEFYSSAMSSGKVMNKWAHYFEGMTFPYGFYGPNEYRPWLDEAGLSPMRIELIPRDMAHKGKEGLAGWIRTTWMPYTSRVSEDKREQFIDEVANEYIAHHPLDENGMAHLSMYRLEVEAVKKI